MSLAVQPQEGFVENLVTIPNAAYLDNQGAMPTDAASFLFFGSLIHGAGSSRTALASWINTVGRIYTLYNSDGSGTCGASVSVGTAPSGNRVAGEVKPVLFGDRYHFLVSGVVAGGKITVDVWLWSGSWFAGFSAENNTSNTVFDFGTSPLRLFSRNDQISHLFSGKVARLAMWTSTDAAPIADISSPDVHKLLVSKGVLVDPQLAVDAFGQGLFDFYGPAEDWEAGVHAGSLPAFAKFGTPIAEIEPPDPDIPVQILDTPTLDGSPVGGTRVSAQAALYEGSEPVTTTFDWLLDGVYVSLDADFFDIPTSEDEQTLSFEQTSYNDFSSDTVASDPYIVPGVSAPPPQDTTAPLIYGLFASYDSAANDLTIQTYIAESESLPVTVWVVSSPQVPSIQQIKGGLSSDGQPATIAASWARSTTGINTIPVSDPAPGDYSLWVLAMDAAGINSAIQNVGVTI